MLKLVFLPLTRKLKCCQISLLYSTRSINQKCSIVGADASEFTDEPEYPVIKPRFPPGKWENWKEKDAWAYWCTSDDLSEVPKLHEKIEKIASLDEDKPAWKVNSADGVPRILPYQQHICKTHIIDGLPNIYDGIDTSKYQDLVRTVVENTLIQQTILQEKKVLEDDEEASSIDKRYISDFLCFLINNLRACLSGDNEHLLTSHFDEDAKISSFWKLGGYANYPDDEDNIFRGKNNLGIMRLQFDARVNFILRSEYPLPGFIPQDDPLCLSSDVPDLSMYAPTALGQFAENTTPKVSAGYKTKNQFIEGSPCEWGYLMCLDGVPHVFGDFEYDEHQVAEWNLGHGMLTSFAWTLAQAYNQGFSYLNEVTYPFTSQAIVKNGNKLKFICYQMNTVQLWKENVNNPLRNICWHTPEIELYKSIDGESVIGLNEEALTLLTKFFLLKPVNNCHASRPYLEELPPNSIKAYMNIKGEPKIERPHPPRVFPKPKTENFHDFHPIKKTNAIMDQAYEEYERKWNPETQKWK